MIGVFIEPLLEYPQGRLLLSALVENEGHTLVRYVLFGEFFEIAPEDRGRLGLPIPTEQTPSDRI